MWIARLQALVTLGVPVLLWALAIGLWPQQRMLAWFALVAPVFLTPGLLALQFFMLAGANRHDPAPRARGAQMLRAWVGEAWAGWRVFHWWQPFRSRAWPDVLTPTTQRGVVLIHGFFCNRGFWQPWLERLTREGRAFVAVDLEPVFGSIDDYIDTVERAVCAVAQATGQPPLLVCHSMGGLAARAWAQSREAYNRVHRIVTLGTPHQGTWLSRLAHATNGRQMRQSGPWLSALAQREQACGQFATHFVCYFSNCDNIVFPVSNATLEGADNRLEPGYGHVELAFSPRIQREVWSLFDLDLL